MARHRARKIGEAGRTIMSCWLVLGAVALVSAGGQQIVDEREATRGAVEALAPPTTSSGDLDEREVPMSACRADDDQPRTITLEPLDRTACLQPVGETDGRMEAPGNIHVAGWYTGGPRPGTGEGLAIVDGHSSGRYRDGVFDDLGTLRTGARIEVAYGDGTTHTFRVVKTASHPADETMRRMRADAEEESADLALITCDGAYDADEHSYADRVVVLAVRT